MLFLYRWLLVSFLGMKRGSTRSFLGRFLLVSLLALTGGVAGCQRKGEPMKNMIVETGRSQNTRPILTNQGNTSKFVQPEPERSPKPPPMKTPLGG